MELAMATLTQAGKKELVMLVGEDDPNDVTLLTHALHRNGIPARTEIVGDGDEVMKHLKGEGEFSDRHAHPLPDLLILDLKMPLVNGVEVLKWLRSRPESANLPVIMLSGSGLEKDVEEAYRLGVRTYFTKPHSVAELGNLLRLIVGYWSASEQPPRKPGDRNPKGQ